MPLLSRTFIVICFLACRKRNASGGLQPLAKMEDLIHSGMRELGKLAKLAAL